jgi:hypothetical protein
MAVKFLWFIAENTHYQNQFMNSGTTNLQFFISDFISEYYFLSVQYFVQFLSQNQSIS